LAPQAIIAFGKRKAKGAPHLPVEICRADDPSRGKRCRPRAAVSGLSLSCRLAKCGRSIRSFTLDVPDEIADYFYRRDIRKFNANELVFDRYYQLELIEPVNAKIVTEMRFIYNLIHVNTEILGNKST
jgi:hypothetical protein